MSMGIDVIVGPVALHVGDGWVGVASGNKYCKKHRKTAKKALKDATKLEVIQRERRKCE